MARSAAIFDRAQTCIDLFHNVLSATRGDEGIDSNAELAARLEDELGRFSIWAGNIGVFAVHENTTLDYRVRDAPQIKDLIVQQLDGLAKYLKHAIEITRHEAWRTSPQLTNVPDEEGIRAGLSISSAPDSSSSSDLSVTQSEVSSQSPLKMAIEDIEKTITRLYRLSVAIRKSATQNRKTKAASYVDRDENGHDMSSEFEKFAIRLIRLKYPVMSQALCKRLGYANSLRRRQFLYRQRHQQKLSLGLKNRTRNIAVDSRSEIEYSYLTPQNRIDGQSSPALQHDRKGALLSQTMATSLEIRSFRPGDALSKVSTAITTAPMQSSFDVPPPPRLTPKAKEFQCPYCCLILPVKVASTSRWRHHVKKDLEPYVCLFEECTEPHTLFATTEAWLSHMQLEHTIQWRCNAPGHPPQSFGKERDLDDHIRSSHAGTFTESQLPLLKRRSAQPAPETFVSCPLCGYPPAESPNRQNSGKYLEDLPNHIAVHLQSIAVMSLPWRDDFEEVVSSNRTSAPKARDSIPDLEDQLSDLSFDKSPRIVTDGSYVLNEETGIEQDSGSRDDEWGFIALPPYEGHTTDSVLRTFISKLTQTANVVASRLIRDLRYSVEANSRYFRDLHPMPSICEKLYGELLRILGTLRNLQARLELIQPEDPWFEFFVDKAKPGGTRLADGSLQLNGTTGTDGPLMQLDTCLQQIQGHFKPQPSLQGSRCVKFFPVQDRLEELLSELYASHEPILSVSDKPRSTFMDNDHSTGNKRLWEGFEKPEPPVVKEILHPPREKFPEDSDPVRERVAPYKHAGQKGIPPNARWTKIDRKLVSPEALEMGNERYKERVDDVIVLRVLTKEEVQEYVAKTQEIRKRRESIIDEGHES